MPITDAVRTVIENAPLAHLCTLNPDGSQQVTVVWVGIEDDEIVTAHLGEWKKVKNIRNDSRVSLSMLAEGANEIGLHNYLVVYGTARVTEGGAPELLQRLAERYLGPGVKFPPMDDPPPGLITRISVDRVAGVGPWA